MSWNRYGHTLDGVIEHNDGQIDVVFERATDRAIESDIVIVAYYPNQPAVRLMHESSYSEQEGRRLCELAVVIAKTVVQVPTYQKIEDKRKT